MAPTYDVLGTPEVPIFWPSFLSRQDEKEPKRAEAAGRQTAHLKRRILVVEDHDDTLRSMKLLLHRLGYEVLTADNMEDALRIASEQPFDILLSDIGLPDGSGLELLRRIRSIREVPALALSGFGMDEDIERSREAGFSDHLTKPVSIDRLQAAIEQLESDAG